MMKKTMSTITMMLLLPFVAVAQEETHTEVPVQPTEVAVVSVRESSSQAQRSTTCFEKVQEHVRRTVVAPSQTNSANHFDKRLVGEVLGGAAGGILGSRLGKGNGRTTAAAAGAMVGTIVGNRLSANTDRHDSEARNLREEWVVVDRLVESPCIKTVDIPGYTVAFTVNGEVRSVFVEKSESHRYR